MWQQMQTTNRIPVRSAHGMVALNERWLCVHAGMSTPVPEKSLTEISEPLVLNDIWLLDTHQLQITPNVDANVGSKASTGGSWMRVHVPENMIQGEPRLDFAVQAVAVRDAEVGQRLGLDANGLVDKVVVSGGMDLNNVWQTWWIMDPWTDINVAATPSKSVATGSSGNSLESVVRANGLEREEGRSVCGTEEQQEK